MTLPLDGIRVIDLGQVYAAPYCTLQLAAMGADVIKIEPPIVGDVLRRPDIAPGGANYSFLMLNANKRSVTINLKDPRGREIVLKLLEDADVLVENFLDGVMESFGLGYEQIAARFPRLIYASGKGYGSNSRYAKLGSMDNTIQASSGFISITGFPDQPVKTSATFIDMGTGSHLVSGILAALIHRSTTGRGQHVEVAMLDVAIPALTSAVAPALQGMKFRRLGNRHWGACPTNIYPASDGEILIFCLTEAHWRTLAKLMGREELIDDPRCRNHGTRLKIADELHATVSNWTRPQARDAMVQLLITAGIPCAPVRNVEEVVADPELIERRTLIDSEYPTRGAIRVAGTPIKLSNAPDSSVSMRRPPELGEHTSEVLASIGYPAGEIEILKRDGVV
ncbi:MAG TPA: CoA transferase [Candidatus Acidoferrales bacterium]|nr:CoA transferase [Candidatus Acidoferrales bacterium]